MNEFTLKKHSVKSAYFKESSEKKKRKNIEIGVEGSVLIPKEHNNDECIIIQLFFHAGSSEEYFDLQLETISVFGIVEKDLSITEEVVKQDCLPIALMQLRNTIEMVTQAYGKPALKLPPFDKEIVE